MNVDDCIEDIAVQPVMVLRRTPDQMVKGFPQPGTLKEFEITASVQPMNQKEMQLLPEGSRNTGGVKLYTSCELFTVDSPGGAGRPDRVTFNSVEYVVQAVDTWLPSNFFRILATRAQ